MREDTGDHVSSPEVHTDEGERKDCLRDRAHDSPRWKVYS
jgi:hypothetical protein